MKKFTLILSLTLSVLSSMSVAETAPADNKIVHGDYKNWSLLSVSHRLDKKTLRAILGNDVAINAARAGNTKVWPDGSILAKVVWKEKTHPNWPQAVVPDTFEKAEAMVKDSKKYAATGGWGFAAWNGGTLVMYDAAKSQECLACHMPMKDNDYVYTTPMLP